jgi:VIT1/CCC1 family predicted Fe2+/Mn2+ transporter
MNGRVLDPVARTSEVLFGLIMALTFTGTLSAATAGREEIRTLLLGMIGCNLAWGLVDAVMFLMQAVTERGRGLLTSPEPRPMPELTKEDWLGALAVFLLVFLSTFPIVIPFLVFRNVHVALRVSNLVAIVMMFIAGYEVAKHAGYHPWRIGFSVVLLGVVLVGITIALGG